MAIKVGSTKRAIHFIKCMVYGESGTGKTVLCSTAPNPIIISAEEGLLSLAQKDLPVIEVTSFAQAKEALLYAVKNDYDTVCLDSLSELAEILLGEFKALEKDPRKAYLKMGEELAEIMRYIRKAKKHVIITAKQGLIKDEFLGRVTYAPSAPGQAFTQQIPYFLDEVFCLRVKKGGERYIQTQPNIQYLAKDRSGLLDKEEIPNLTHIFNKILRGHTNGNTSKR